MNKTDDILKRILLNMKYMVENKKTIDNLLVEAPTTEPPNGQQIPITMNQIMQFQKYIWSTIEKDIPKVANTCRSKDKKQDCAYNSMLCPATKKPCWKKDAVDGLWGGSTITAWDKYKQKYKAFNPNWWIDDGKTGAELNGQQIPVTSLQTKNFQKWYLEQIEKSKPNLKGLYTTKLCKTPCTYNQAVDGVFGSIGSNTRTLWDTYKDSYMKSNPNWYAEVDFDQNVVRSQEKIMKIQKTFIFTKPNPSGYNGTSPVTDIPKWIVANKDTLFKFDEESATKMANNYGWDVNPKLFPPPKEYSESDFDLFMPDDGPEKLKQINNEKQDWYLYLQQNKSDRLGAGGTFEKQTSVMTGIPTRGERYEENWEQRTRQAKGPQSVAAETWNTDFRIVKRVINEKCKRPLMVTGNADDEAENPVYISYSDICYYAGGLWVWNAGEGPNAYCGCRYMNRKNGLVGEQIFSVKGPNGQDLTVQIDFRSSMEYQTPGGKKDNEEYQAIHDVLTVVELGLIAVSFVAGPAAPLFIGVSALVGVADSAIYFQQGDKYMGIMMMAISMLGIDDVVSLVKYAAAKTTIKTLGKEGIQAIAKKQLAKEVLSESEELAVREIQTAVYQSQNGLNSSMKLAMMDEFVTTGVYSTAIKNNWGWDKFFEMYYKINKKLLNLPSFTMMTIKIGGIAYTVDQVYLAFYGNDEDRKYSSFGQLFDYFKNASEAEKMQEAQKQFEKMQKEIAKNPKKFLNPETIDQAIGFDWSKTVPMDQLKAYYMALNQWKDPKNAKEQQKIQKEHEFTEAPFLAEVESGESVLSWGVSGDSVTEIQKLLSEKGYDLNVNGIFDMDMIFVVAEFQSKNSLNENGIVDSQTLSKLKSSEKEMNCTEKINSMISSGWVEINKTEYVKKIQSKVSTEKLKEIECNGVKKYFFDSSQKDQPRQVGQAPILKTIVDNPDLQEVYLNFKRFI
jgi:hypothetical protein